MLTLLWCLVDPLVWVSERVRGVHLETDGERIARRFPELTHVDRCGGD